MFALIKNIKIDRNLLLFALITLHEILNTSVDFDEHTNTMAKEEYIAICMEI